MRYEKTLYAPEEKFEIECVDPSRPAEGREISLLHMRPSAAGLVCAEGYEAVSVLPSAVSRLYVTDDAVYVYESVQKSLYNVTAKTRITGIASEPVALLPHVTENGARGFYCVEKDTVRYITGGAVKSSGRVGGTCAAMHHGRLFTADGLTLRFSAPYSADGIIQTDRDPDKAGSLDFDEGKGNIVALVSFREKLYIFFERGIAKMRAEGEALDFDVTAMPFCGGSVIRGSVADCGDRICYMTESGLYCFNGSVCSRLEGKRAEILRSSSFEGLCMNGKYAAVVTLTDAKNALYVYDFSEKAGRFILASGLISAAREYFVTSTTLYTLKEEGTQPLGGEASLLLTLSGTPRALAWMRIDGKGIFGIMTNATENSFLAEKNEKVHICAKKRLFEVQITLLMKSASCRIRKIEFAWRKEDGN